MHLARRLATMVLLCLLAANLGSVPVGAAVPNTISYQGLLTDGAGTPVPDGPYDLTLKLYTVPSGGGVLWSETQSGVPVVTGIFSIELGSVAGLTLPFDQPYWLGVSIGIDPELVPRTPLTSAPYALNVRSVDAQVIIDEPGIAQSIYPGTYNVIGNANINPILLHGDLGVTITTPGPGYVMLNATAYITFSSVTAHQYVEYQISETTGMSSPFFLPQEANYLKYCGFGLAPNTNYFDFPMSDHRVFYKPVAGAYRFHFLTARLGSFTPQASVTNLSLTATYVPTSYGTVMAAPGGPVDAAHPVFTGTSAGVSGDSGTRVP
ncbi:MAG: hypothetical protein FD129_1293 [bacterium]|nr:MAG: hypothetical protein FD129_1293 [bacterium]